MQPNDITQSDAHSHKGTASHMRTHCNATEACSAGDHGLSPVLVSLPPGASVEQAALPVVSPVVAHLWACKAPCNGRPGVQLLSCTSSRRSAQRNVSTECHVHASDLGPIVGHLRACEASCDGRPGVWLLSHATSSSQSASARGRIGMHDSASQVRHTITAAVPADHHSASMTTVQIKVSVAIFSRS